MTVDPAKDVERICRACGQVFTVTSGEVRFLEETARHAGWSQVGLPTRCLPCRKQQRDNIVPIDTPLQWYEADCHDCGAVFKIGPRDVEYYRGRYAWPKRCRPCRIARASARP